MSSILVSHSGVVGCEVSLPTSKSISNRLLILQALYPNVKIRGLSSAKDTVVLKEILASDEHVLDVGHAGTAMRFLTAFFACSNKEVFLIGSERMNERPIGVLVNALRDLGADVEYQEKESFPPLRIKGNSIEGGTLEIESNISSQFITALLLVGPKFKKGLTIRLNGEIVSKPYIDLTLSVLKLVGLKADWNKNEIIIPGNQKLEKVVSVDVEKDWSSAGFWYQVVALSQDGQVFLKGLNKESLQGDSELVNYFEYLGVFTTKTVKGIIIKKENTQANFIELELGDTPDIVQPFVVAAAALGVETKLKGLSTLKIKETDRLVALKAELKKVGVLVSITDDTLSFKPAELIKPTESFKTYKDHRMAMALAPLGILFNAEIENPEVVEKSYPEFWKDLESAGFLIK